MLPDPTLTLAEQIVHMVDIFLKTLAPEACKLRVGLLSCAIWNRVRRLERRFLALYAMWKAGTLPQARARRGTSDGGRCPPYERGEAPSESVATVTRPASLMPRGVRWMQRMLPFSAAALAYGVGSLIDNHPEMKAFVTECPQVRRVLRPWCRMAGLTPPEWLALPRRVRAVAHPPPRPTGSSPVASLCSPARGEGEGKRRRRTPREVAQAAMERSLRTGKPIDPAKIGAVAYGYVLHWPRDENCPLPEIGYGGRMFPPLPKDYVRPKDD